jgi:hypothetical protein
MDALSFSNDDFLPNITKHADFRMGNRRIRRTDVAVALSYGRQCFIRGAVIYVMGRREVAFCQARGMLVDQIQGLQVVCNADDDTVITVYRNNDFSRLRKIKKRAARKYD